MTSLAGGSGELAAPLPCTLASGVAANGSVTPVWGQRASPESKTLNPFPPEDHHGGLHPYRQRHQLPWAHVLEMELRWGAIATGFRAGDGPAGPCGPRGGRPPGAQAAAQSQSIQPLNPGWPVQQGTSPPCPFCE
jgi:hypothetical protein